MVFLFQGDSDNIGLDGARGDDPPAQVNRRDEDSGYRRGRHRWQYPDKYHDPKRYKGPSNQPNNALYPVAPSGHSQNNPFSTASPRFSIHLSILKPLATPMVLSSQALGASCRLKRGSYSSPLRVIPNTEASSGARQQGAKVERTHMLSPILIWFILSNHLPHQTRASGQTIITNSGAITVTEATATGETDNDPETGDGIHSMDI